MVMDNDDVNLRWESAAATVARTRTSKKVPEMSLSSMLTLWKVGLEWDSSEYDLSYAIGGASFPISCLFVSEQMLIGSTCFVRPGKWTGCTTGHSVAISNGTWTCWTITSFLNDLCFVSSVDQPQKAGQQQLIVSSVPILSLVTVISWKSPRVGTLLLMVWLPDRNFSGSFILRSSPAEQPALQFFFYLENYLNLCSMSWSLKIAVVAVVLMASQDLAAASTPNAKRCAEHIEAIKSSPHDTVFGNVQQTKAKNPNVNVVKKVCQKKKTAQQLYSNR